MRGALWGLLIGLLVVASFVVLNAATKRPKPYEQLRFCYTGDITVDGWCKNVHYGDINV